MRSRSPKKLFTLIEMMLVIGIIAILAAIAVPNLIEAQEHAKETAVLSEMNAIQVAQEIFFVGDKDNDGVSDYGTLQELIDANLIDPTFVKSERDGFGRALVRQLEALFGAKIGAGLGAGLSVGFLEIAPKLTQAELDALAKAEAEAKAKAEAEADAKAKAEAEAKADDPALKADDPVLKADDPALKADDPALKADDPVLKADDPVLKTDDPVLKTDDPIVKAADSDVAAGFDDLGPGPIVKADRPLVQPVETDEGTALQQIYFEAFNAAIDQAKKDGLSRFEAELAAAGAGTDALLGTGASLEDLVYNPDAKDADGFTLQSFQLLASDSVSSSDFVNAGGSVMEAIHTSTKMEIELAGGKLGVSEDQFSAILVGNTQELLADTGMTLTDFAAEDDSAYVLGALAAADDSVSFEDVYAAVSANIDEGTADALEDLTFGAIASGISGAEVIEAGGDIRTVGEIMGQLAADDLYDQAYAEADAAYAEVDVLYDQQHQLYQQLNLAEQQNDKDLVGQLQGQIGDLDKQIDDVFTNVVDPLNEAADKKVQELEDSGALSFHSLAGGVATSLISEGIDTADVLQALTGGEDLLGAGYADQVGAFVDAGAEIAALLDYAKPDVLAAAGVGALDLLAAGAGLEDTFYGIVSQGKDEGLAKDEVYGAAVDAALDAGVSLETLVDQLNLHPQQLISSDQVSGADLVASGLFDDGEVLQVMAKEAGGDLYDQAYAEADAAEAKVDVLYDQQDQLYQQLNLAEQQNDKDLVGQLQGQIDDLDKQIDDVYTNVVDPLNEAAELKVQELEDSGALSFHSLAGDAATSLISEGIDTADVLKALTGGEDLKNAGFADQLGDFVAAGADLTALAENGSNAFDLAQAGVDTQALLDTGAFETQEVFFASLEAAAGKDGFDGHDDFLAASNQLASDLLDSGALTLTDLAEFAKPEMISGATDDTAALVEAFQSVHGDNISDHLINDLSQSGHSLADLSDAGLDTADFQSDLSNELDQLQEQLTAAKEKGDDAYVAKLQNEIDEIGQALGTSDLAGPTAPIGGIDDGPIGPPVPIDFKSAAGQLEDEARALKEQIEIAQQNGDADAAKKLEEQLDAVHQALAVTDQALATSEKLHSINELIAEAKADGNDDLVKELTEKQQQVSAELRDLVKEAFEFGPGLAAPGDGKGPLDGFDADQIIDRANHEAERLEDMIKAADEAGDADLVAKLKEELKAKHQEIDDAKQGAELQNELTVLQKELAEAAKNGDADAVAQLKGEIEATIEKFYDLASKYDGGPEDGVIIVDVDDLGDAALTDQFQKELERAKAKAEDAGEVFDEKQFAEQFAKQHGVLLDAIGHLIGPGAGGPIDVVTGTPSSPSGPSDSVGGKLEGPYFESAGGSMAIQTILPLDADGHSRDYLMSAQPLNTKRKGVMMLLSRTNKNPFIKRVEAGTAPLLRSALGHMGKDGLPSPEKLGFKKRKR